MLPLALFAVSLAIFHVSEFLMVAKYNRALLSVDSLLVSKEYLVAVVSAVLEYLVEQHLYPELKASSLWIVGLTFLILGQSIRLAALLMLLNPLCLIGYAIVIRLFFKHRVDAEEYILHTIFGEEYDAYAARVPRRVPLLSNW
ncbi:hypothetical protein H632_c423p2 [Helicosporidium sp. ATCC 50920]|nr:hypothetical protein H632_c423p2 [Helicosporidium sp. ATCC 50920]|eukprot:KDD75949.1 hypothetical protein H632_c423p2 [Helicosporidium sp. ATCC 50920]